MQVIIFSLNISIKNFLMNLKISSYFFFIGVVLLTTFSSLFAEEKKIPLDASERKLLEQSRIEVPSHYIEPMILKERWLQEKKPALSLIHI